MYRTASITAQKLLAARTCHCFVMHLVLVHPRLVGLLPGVDLLLLEPEVDLLLGRVDAVGAVADVAANILEHAVSIPVLRR